MRIAFRKVASWLAALAAMAGMGWLFVATHPRGGQASLVPLGSNLSDLDSFVDPATTDSAEVVKWIPVTGSSTGGEKRLTNELGTFLPKKLGAYGPWNAPADERDQFTGEITFTETVIDFEDFPDSTVVHHLIYFKGKLHKNDWGYLPG